MKLNSFFKQCQEKEVFKMVSIYVVSTWVILQVLAVTWQPLGLPQKFFTLTIIVLLLGFPGYLFFLWKYRVVPLHRAERETDIEPDKTAKRERTTFKKIYFSFLGVITILCVIAVLLIVNRNFPKENNIAIPPTVKNDKIAVLKFGNNTGDPKYDIVGKMASDWIIHGITENQVAQVITQDLVDEYKSLLKGKNIEANETTIVKEYLKPSKIISGNFYLKDGKLLFQAMLVDGKTNKTNFSFKPTECAATSPLQCIEDLNESITGYFITEGNKKLMLQETPPKYEAYKNLIEAKYSNDKQEYINLLNKAIAADSTYFEPKVLRVGHYYNEKDFKKADSLLKLIKPDSYTNKRQLNLLNMYRALLSGDNRTVYNTILKEYELAPFDLKTNRTAMVVALQFINKPEDVEAIYKTVAMDSINLQNCSDCIMRIYVKAYADIELQKYSQAIASIENVHKETEAKLLNRPLVIAYVRSGKDEALSQFLKKIEITANPAETQELYLQSGKEFLLKNENQKAQTWFAKIIDSDAASVTPKTLAAALFYNKEFAKAKIIFEEIQEKTPEDIETLTKLAICNYKIENISEAKNNINSLETLRANYQFGEVDYALSQFYAAANKERELYDHLFRAAANGHLFHWKYFKNDPQFQKFNTSEEFKKILNYWK